MKKVLFIHIRGHLAKIQFRHFTTLAQRNPEPSSPIQENIWPGLTETGDWLIAQSCLIHLENDTVECSEQLRVIPFDNSSPKELSLSFKNSE